LDQQEDANKKWYNHVKTCSLDLAEEIANKYSSITKIIIIIIIIKESPWIQEWAVK
jgi:hypothetical protein